jgi:hypothetical protein
MPTNTNSAPGTRVTTPHGDGIVSPGKVAGSDSILVALADGTLRLYGPDAVGARAPLAVCGRGCELPADSFFRLPGDHCCGEDGLRTSYCEACDSTIESEGLCGHGAYPDQCGHADSVLLVEWAHLHDSDWTPEGEPIDDDSAAGLHELRNLRNLVAERIGEVFADCTGEVGGPYAVDVDSILPGNGSGDVVNLPPMQHADGQTWIRARVRRGSL